MSIIDKLKDFLSPEIDGSEPETKHSDNQKHSEKKKEVMVEHKREIEIKSDKEEYQFEETFKFPMAVEEDFLDDFVVIEKERPKKEETRVYQHVTPTRDIKVQPLVKKPFRPSPVISPVYGLINEEVINNRKVTPTVNKVNEPKAKKVTFDTIRQKAYGSLEDDIEKVINDGTDIFFDLEKEEPEDDNIVAEFVEDQNDISSLTLEEAEESYEYRGVATNVNKKPNPEDILDLVDEMYKQEGK